MNDSKLEIYAVGAVGLNGYGIVTEGTNTGGISPQFVSFALQVLDRLGSISRGMAWPHIRGNSDRC